MGSASPLEMVNQTSFQANLLKTLKIEKIDSLFLFKVGKENFYLD